MVLADIRVQQSFAFYWPVNNVLPEKLQKTKYETLKASYRCIDALKPNLKHISQIHYGDRFPRCITHCLQQDKSHKRRIASCEIAPIEKLGARNNDLRILRAVLFLPVTLFDALFSLVFSDIRWWNHRRCSSTMVRRRGRPHRHRQAARIPWS